MNPKFSMVFIWFLEAAIGIEPMNKGFAVSPSSFPQFR